MNMDYIKNNVQHVSKVLLVLSVGLAALTVKQVSAYMNTSQKIKKTVADAKARNGHDEETVKKLLAAGRETADALKKKNMFAPPPPKPNPPVCYGIIGNAAIINGKYYRAGDKVGGAEIISVGTKDVTIKWQDSEMKLVPFAQQYRASSSSDSSHSPSGGDKDKDKDKQKDSSSKSKTTIVVNEAPRPGMGPGGGRGGFMGMSPEDRQRMIERYRSMSPEEQRRFREEQRRRFMEGGGFRGGGPRGR